MTNGENLGIETLTSYIPISSLDTVNQSQNLKNETEFEDVSTFVKTISSSVKAGLINLNLSSALSTVFIALFRQPERFNFSLFSIYNIVFRII